MPRDGLSLLQAPERPLVVSFQRGLRTLWILMAALPVGIFLIFQFFWGRDLTSSEAPLVVYSYSSFMSPFGPAKDLAEKFKARTGRAVQFVDAGDSQAILERLRFRAPQESVDLVLGLDQLTLTDAQAALPWRELAATAVAWEENLPRESLLKDFLPLQWSPLSFVHRGGLSGVHTLKDLLNPSFHKDIVLLDPRASTPGFQFLYWVVSVMGKEAALEYLQKLKVNVHSVQPSWSTGYQLFQRGEAGAIFTYVTSVAFHHRQGQMEYQTILFEEGLPYQVEYAGIPESCRHCEMAQEFLNFLLEPESQNLMMTKNYMLPVVQGVLESGSVFDRGASTPLRAGYLSKDLAAEKRELLKLWRRAGL